MQAMCPFRNTGWPYYNKISAIMPTTIMKGTHVYRPTTMATISPTNPDTPSTMSSVPPSGSEIIAHNHAARGGSTCGETLVGERTTDGGAISSSTLAGSTGIDVDSYSPLSSVNLGKCTHSIMSLGSSDIDNPQAHSTPATSFGHIKKKQMSLNAGCSDIKGSNFGGSKAASGKSNAGGAGKSRSEKVSQAAAVMGMQGLINRLTDVFEKSLSQADDSIADRQALAVDLVQK